MNMYRTLLLPAGILAATVIGAGMFALPAVTAEAGLIPAFFYLVLFSGVFVLIHLLYADIILRTPENHRFAGYAKIHLGNAAEWIAVLTTIIGMIFTLTAELVLAVSFLKFFIPHLELLPALITVWAIGSLAVFLPINKLAASELLMASGMVAIVLLLLAYGFPNFPLSLSPSPLSLPALLLPYGAILFALDGRPAITTVLGYFRNNAIKSSPLPAILMGTLVPALVYILFVVAVLILTPAPTEDTVSGLAAVLPSWLMLFIALLGAVAVFSTYIAIGRDVKKSLEHDLHWRVIFSGLAVVLSPIFLYFVGFQQFLTLVGITGGVFIGLEGILIVWMWRRASLIPSSASLVIGHWSSVVGLLTLVFAVGIGYEVYKIISNF